MPTARKCCRTNSAGPPTRFVRALGSGLRRTCWCSWDRDWSTNPLERVNKEIKRRTDVVGTFPNPAALLRLAGHVLIEQHDEWDGAERRYFSEHSMTLLNTTEEEVTIPELAAA